MRTIFCILVAIIAFVNLNEAFSQKLSKEQNTFNNILLSGISDKEILLYFSKCNQFKDTINVYVDISSTILDGFGNVKKKRNNIIINYCEKEGLFFFVGDPYINIKKYIIKGKIARLKFVTANIFDSKTNICNTIKCSVFLQLINEDWTVTHIKMRTYK